MESHVTIVGLAAVQSVLKGKHYNRAFHCHKLLLEALRLSACEDWLEQGDNVCGETFKSSVAALQCELTKEKIISVGRHQQSTFPTF